MLVTGQLIKDQYGLATRWNLANGWSSGDDHGMFSQGNEPGVQRFEPRPVFYYLTFMQRYFGDVMLNSSVTGNVFEVYPNYPNPFKNNTTIKYSLKMPAQVKVRIYNINGQLVKKLEDNKKATGFYQLKWNGKNEKGKTVPEGIYFYRFEITTQDGFYSETKNMSFTR